MDNLKISPIAWAMMRDALLNDIDSRINDKEAELKKLKQERSKLIAEGDNVGVGKRSIQKQKDDKFDDHNIYMLCNDFAGTRSDNVLITQKDIIIQYYTLKYIQHGHSKIEALYTAEGLYPAKRKALTRYISKLKNVT